MKILKIACTDERMKNTQAQLTVSVSAMLALIQACEFTLANKEHFEKICECDDCFATIQSWQKDLAAMIIESQQLPASRES